MRNLVTVTACLVLVACNSHDSGPGESEQEEAGAYAISAVDGETVARVRTADGTAEMRSGQKVPVKLAAGFTVFPGASVSSNTTVTQNGSRGSIVAFETDASPEEVAEFYRDQARAARIEIEVELTVDDGKLLVGKGAKGETFTLNVSVADGTTASQLMVGQNFGG